MKLQTHLHAPSTTLYRFRAHLPDSTDPLPILAACHMDACAQVIRRYSPRGPWRLELWLQGTRVGEWALEPSQARQWPSQSQLSPEVRAEVVA